MHDKNPCDGNMKTILAKTLVGKAVQSCQSTVYISPEEDVEPNQVLGCFITNANIHSAKLESITHEYITVRIDGNFQVDLWYSTNENTALSKGNTEFSQVIRMKIFEQISRFKENDLTKNVKAWINKNPICLGSIIVDRNGVPTIAAQLEYELIAEIFEESKINVFTCKPSIKYKELTFNSDTTFFDKFFNNHDID